MVYITHGIAIPERAVGWQARKPGLQSLTAHPCSIRSLTCPPKLPWFLCQETCVLTVVTVPWGFGEEPDTGLDEHVFLVSLPSTPSSGTSTIRTRASGRRSTGAMITGATPGTHRGAQAHSSQCVLEAPAGFLHQRPPRLSLSTPTGSRGAGDGSSQGCLPSEGLFPHTGPGISSGFKQATMTFYFLFVPLPSSSSLPTF